MTPATLATTVDASVQTLAGRSRVWLDVPIAEKADHLRTVMARFVDVSDDLIADAVRAKGLDASYGGEDWVSGPISFLRTCRFLAETLDGIDQTGRVALVDEAFGERPDGRVTVDVMPGDCVRRWRPSRVPAPGSGRGRRPRTRNGWPG
ncbi:MAG: hypothetical protein AAB198_03740 [Actinomycetota bacterium]